MGDFVASNATHIANNEALDQPLDIEIIQKDSLVSRIFNTNTITEKYYCNFGLNPEYQEQIHQAGFRMVASDKHKEARIMELKDHPFFVATLFVPQVNSSYQKPHPIIMALLTAMEQHNRIDSAEVSDTTAAK